MLGNALCTMVICVLSDCIVSFCLYLPLAALVSRLIFASSGFAVGVNWLIGRLQFWHAIVIDVGSLLVVIAIGILPLITPIFGSYEKNLKESTKKHDIGYDRQCVVW